MVEETRYTGWPLGQTKTWVQLEDVIDPMSTRPEFQIDLETGQVFLEFWGMKVVEISKGVWCRVR
jgi:hypothetical protein